MGPDASVSANKEGLRHKRPLCALASIEHLLVLRRAITFSNHFHVAVWAVALVTFFGCHHLGETTVSSVSSFDPSFHILCSAEYAQVDHHIISYFTHDSLQCFLSTLFEMAHVLPPSVYCGQKPLAKKVLPLSLQLATTKSAPVWPCRTTSIQIGMFPVPCPCLPTLQPMVAGNT